MKLNDDHYIININNDVVSIARYDNTTKKFYSYKKLKIDIFDNKEIKIGQEVKKVLNGDNSINEDIIKSICEYQIHYKELEEKYKDFDPLKLHIETLFSILDEHFNSTISVDSFDFQQANWIYCICKALGLETILDLQTSDRIKYNIIYLEDIVEIAEAIKNILQKYSFSFHFYDYIDNKKVLSKKFIQFRCEIERRTHVNMSKITTKSAVIQRLLESRDSKETILYRHMRKSSPYIEFNSDGLYYYDQFDLDTIDNRKWTLQKEQLKRRKDYK